MTASLTHRLIRLTRWTAPIRVRNSVAPSAVVDFRKIRLCRGGVVRIAGLSIVRAKLIAEKDGAAISIGERTFVGASTIVAAVDVSIGSDVLVSWGVTIADHDSHSVEFAQRAGDVRRWYAGMKDWDGVDMAPVKLCDKVWIGFGATILKGVTIGEGAIVAACTVVTKDVEPWTIVAGNPARVIRQLAPGPALVHQKSRS